MFFAGLYQKLKVILEGIEKVMATQQEIQAAIDANTAAVAASTSVVSSAVAALNGITQLIVCSALYGV